MKCLTIILAAFSMLIDGWRMEPSVLNGMPALDVELPTTVLGAYVKAGICPDPRIGLNFYDIPDVSAPGSPWTVPYVFSTVFRPDSLMQNASNYRLRLNGINYRADVRVNGVKVADRDSTVGMFRRFTFDVTSLLNRQGDNTISITVYQVDHPGKCLPGTQSVPFGPKRGSAREIWRDETLKLSGGWDCAPVVADRNYGITLPVELLASGDACLGDPATAVKLSKGRAEMDVTVPVTAFAETEAELSLTVNFPDGREPITVCRKIALKKGETQVRLPLISISEPALWWPNGYGDHPLHRLSLSLYVDGLESDRREFDTGLREITSEIVYNHGEPARVFKVNGRRIFCRGGWIQPDILLQNEDFEHQAALLEHAGCNIAGSEDMPAPPDEFFSALDRHGILYWHVFHQCWRMYPGTATAHNPDDHELAAVHVRDEILRYRTHACIGAWVGVNEVMVDEDLYLATRNAVMELDPSRPFLPTTSVDWDVDSLTPFLKPDLPLGTTDAGAPDYGWEAPEYYFRKIDEIRDQTFRNELGMPAVPLWSSLRRFIPSLDRPFDASDPIFPLDEFWAEHGAWDSNNFCFRSYDNALRTIYPDPRSAGDYVRHAQLASYDGYRAMWEAAGHRMWDVTTGVMLWKLNSCWPDVCWQIYDWYLAPNSAYFATRKALERVHLQMNADDNGVCVVNLTDETFKAKVLVEVFTPSMTCLGRQEYELKVGADAVTNGKTVELPRMDTNCFIRLRLLRGETLLSENLYWRALGHNSFYGILNMPDVELQIDKLCKLEDGFWKMEIVLSNPTDRLSFFNQMELKCGGQTVNPVFWSDNFVSVFPGESLSVTAMVPVSACPCEPELILEDYGKN